MQKTALAYRRLSPLPSVENCQNGADRQLGIVPRSLIKTLLVQDRHAAAVVFLQQPQLRLTRKMLLVMKLTFILLTAALLSVHASGLSQNITLAAKQASLAEVFDQVEKKTTYVFLYKKDDLRNTKRISIEANNLSIEQFLQKLLAGQSLEYTIKNHSIFITRTVSPDKDSVAQKPLISLWSQSPIKGQVFNQSFLGTPKARMEGASVKIKGTTKGTTSNSSGEFFIDAKIGDILIISYVGYETQEVEVKSELVMVMMKPTNSPLDQVQVTAYGRTTRRMSTGSISTVKAEDIEKQPVLTLQEALVGRVPGITIKPYTGNSAAPIAIEIRGRNTIDPTISGEPLYVIDGIPQVLLNVSIVNSNLPISTGAVQAGLPNLIGENPLLGINPKDIESIDILKDADATAIYGSRGANGVIMITTKKAKSGPTRFNMSINNGFKSIQRFPKLMNTQEYLAVRKEAFQNDGIEPNVDNAPDLTRWDQTKYTDWQRYFGSTGNYLSIDAALSGGISQTSYNVSANHTSTQELMNNKGKNTRSTIRSNLSHTSTDQRLQLNAGTNLAFTEVEAYRPLSLAYLAPNAPDIYNEKGEFNFEPYRFSQGTYFPFSDLKKPSNSKTFSLQGDVTLKYEILRSLSVSATAGYNFSSNDNNMMMPLAAGDPINTYYNTAYFGNSTTRSWSVTPQIIFNERFGKSELTAQVIGSLQAGEAKGVTTIAMMFPNDNMMKSINNAAVVQSMEGFAENRMMSLAAIVKYVWDSKYLINLSARRDGSSRFGPGRRFGDFGSVGAAWIASDEKWMKKILPDWFSFLKLRGSYGITGTDGIGDYEYLSRWATTYSLDNSAPLQPYAGNQAFHVVRALNQEFRWGTNTKRELAIQMGLLRDRINVDLAWYSNLAGNQLTDNPMPMYTGFATVLSNRPAVVENAGIELSINANLINSKDWTLTANFNISRNTNTLKKFPGIEGTPYYQRFKVGQSLNTVYLFHYTGINPLTGDYSFEDYNKDGQITNSGGILPLTDYDDRYVVLDLTPKYMGGFGFNFSWKGLRVGTQFSFVNQLAMDPYLNLAIGRMNNLVVPDDVMNNHWKKPGDIVKYPKFTTYGLNGNITVSDANFVNGSYIRWSNLSMTYQFPERWTSKVKMKGASFGVSTQNLLTITNYKGMDPGTSSLMSPIPRTVTTSLTFNF